MDFMRNLLASIALAAPLAAGAHITAVNVERIEPFANGHAFGAAGPYERVTGKAKGELDPTDVHQRAIVNIAKAPRNARGMVEYEVDFDVLRPLEPARSNGTLLFEVTNRGRKFLLHWLLDAPAQAAAAVNDPRSLRDAGNGLFLERGYTIVWTGWEPEVARANGGMAITLPIATDGGQPIVRTIRDELVSGTRAPPVTAFRLAYEAATLDQSKAVLTVRRKASDTPRIIAANGWTYVDARSIKLLPDATRPEPGSLYVLSYPAKDPKVLGIAFAATRDFVSFMRRPSAAIDPQAKLARPGIQHAIAVGISQSGRYLRDHIASGFNHDEADRKVFDGVLAHISGIGRVFLDTEFGMSGRTNTQHEDHLYPENEFPFSTALATDPLSGKRGTLFRQDGFDPLLIEVNTSTEYWQKGASLLHTDARGERDAVLPSNARVYQIAGTQHGGQPGLTTDAGACVNPRNPHSPAPALRALVVALERWVSEGILPPPSRVPRVRDGTLVEAGKVVFPEIPGFAVARIANEVAPFGDWLAPKPEHQHAYRTLVPRVDADGNEIAGIRLPDIAVPLATYTGWNFYKSPFPEGELCDRDGSYSPFLKTRVEREQQNDPRRSIAERYASQEAYVERVREAAFTLARDGLLLPVDAAGYVLAAKTPALRELFAH